MRWSTARTIPCKPIERGYRYLRCRGFSASALGLSAPPVSEMWLSFDPENKLIGVDVYWRGMSSRQVSAVWEQSTAMLRRTLGDPPIAFGDPQPAALAKHAVETARVQYRYSNYLATVTASHMPESGLAVRLQYLSPGTAPVQPPRSWGQGSRARSVEHAPPISPDPLRGRSLAGADDGMIHPIQ